MMHTTQTATTTTTVPDLARDHLGERTGEEARACKAEAAVHTVCSQLKGLAEGRGK